MVDVYMLAANEGDCILIRYGNDKEKHNILIDGGTETCGRNVKKIIESCNNNGEKMDVIIVTHVDEDHIGGLISGIAAIDEKVLHNCVQNITFNTSIGFQRHCQSNLKITNKPEESVKVTVSETDGCSVGHAKSLCDIIADKGLNDRLTDFIIAGTQMIVGGAILTLLSPDKKSLNKFMNTWKEDLEQEPEKGCAWELPDTIYQDISHLMSKNYPSSDGSPSNRASIAFIFEYEDVSILFLGDAVAPVYVTELKRYMKNKTITLDAIKLPHHGSSRNISEAFLKSINTDTFMISSNGKTFNGQYTVPSKITISKLLKDREKVVLLNNYSWWETTYQNQFFTENDVRDYINCGLLELHNVSKKVYSVNKGLNIYGKL